MAIDIPAPCTLFYLAQCRHGSDCKYGHDYILEEEHYQELSDNAKKTPCKITNEGPLPPIHLFPFLLIGPQVESVHLAKSACMDTYAPKERHVTTSNSGNASFKLVGLQLCHETLVLDLV